MSLYREFLDSSSKVIVTAIDEESQAAELDFHIGDYITHVNGKKIKNLKDFTLSLKKIRKINSKIILSTSTQAFGVFSFNSV